MHTQTILVFLAIKFSGNSNKTLKTDLFKEMILKKFLKTFFFYFDFFFENQLHKMGPIGRANSFACDFGKRGLVLIITNEIKLEISRPLCKGFYRKRV